MYMSSQNALKKVAIAHRSSFNEKVGRPKTRKPKVGEPMHLTINLDGGVIIALDEEAARRNTERRGPAWTRTDVVRDILAEWFERRDKRAK
jgi:hypothetical protein